MMALPKASLFLPLLCMCFFFTLSSADPTSQDALRSDLFSVPSSVFVTSLQTTLQVVQQITSIISQFPIGFADFRVSNAVNDCLELLDLSTDHLTSTLAVDQNPTKKDNATGNVSFDMKTWLSATLENQETCGAGFDGTNTIVKGLIGGGLNQVSDLVTQLLTMVKTTPAKSKRGGAPAKSPPSGRGRFPPWVRPNDRKLMSQGPGGIRVDAVVAKDGTGDFTTIMDAVHSAPDRGSNRYVIYIKKGVYKESVDIKKKKWNIFMFGDGMNNTIITGSKSFGGGYTTFRSATFAVSALGFMARDLTFENTAGASNHQAVALRSDSDLSVFYKCGIRGYQDSLYTHTMRQFYRECHISGTVDFIFGDATVVFQDCLILARQGLSNQKNTITAQGRKIPDQPTGFSFQFCNFTADTDLIPNVNSTQTYLGRPWKPYSRTVIMQSYLSNAIRPEGWLEWNGDFALDTLYYGEYLNYGPGAGLGRRVKWPGYHALNSSAEAESFTVGQFIEGNLWLPSTGVKYISGFSV
uniref:Pectinesterase n=1 Tax=Kalanchoe fedtschenkoi TaxID=63787 RepID=A0A7N0VB77_KALFE